MTELESPYSPPAASLDYTPAAGVASDEVPPEVISVLVQTRPWVRLFAILAVVGVSLMFVAVFFVAIGSIFGAGGPESVLMLLPSLLIMAMYLPPAFFLFGFANNVRKLEDGGGRVALLAALTSQKSFWRYIGILMVVLLGLYVVILLAAGVFGVFSGLGKR